MFCTCCREELPEGAEICPFCGTPVEPVQEEKAEKPENPKPSRRSGKALLPWISAALLLILFLSVLGNRRAEKPAADPGDGNLPEQVSQGEYGRMAAEAAYVSQDLGTEEMYCLVKQLDDHSFSFLDLGCDEDRVVAFRETCYFYAGSLSQEARRDLLQEEEEENGYWQELDTALCSCLFEGDFLKTQRQLSRLEVPEILQAAEEAGLLPFYAEDSPYVQSWQARSQLMDLHYIEK